jgi:fatty-acyl-CoA synthase
LVQDLAARFGEAPALISAQERWSFAELAQRGNRFSRWALAQGIKRGDVAALLMPNRPDYLAVWLGITAVGGVVALINTNLRGQALAHCLNLAAPGHIIVAEELADALATAMPALNADATVWVQGKGVSQSAGIDEAIARHSGAALTADERRGVTLNDCALYMYTSGTTGLPKAAIIDHRRLMTWSLWFAGMMDTRPTDRMYNCLPLYHSVGGVVATGAVLAGGGSVYIAEKFSASQFWDEVTRNDCTLFQYIGELCRYLTNAPAHANETAHRLRLACGNGLRPDVWDRFKNRFRIPQILEFYAATDGNFSLFNVEEKPGSIGRIPSFLAHRSPAAIVKADASLREPLRGADSFCVRCAADEIGLAIGRIEEGGRSPGDGGSKSSGEGSARFSGYTSREETKKKILRNVFAPGDAWFATGDLMRKDAQGHFYYVDRVGDTFRWKGENVATTEVAEAITALPQVADASVYGVVIPGTDGRAGMAALVLKEHLDLVQLRSHLAAWLPSYARPVFLRIRRAIAATDTFKHAKGALAAEGYDPRVIADPLYFDDLLEGAFVPLDTALYDLIQRGGVRL